jgi:hypothetical protein
VGKSPLNNLVGGGFILPVIELVETGGGNQNILRQISFVTFLNKEMLCNKKLNLKIGFIILPKIL